jgi:hypothetical protein
MMVDLEEKRALILGHLKDMGTSKSLGYLPLQTVQKHLSMNVDDFLQSMQEKGLQTKIISAEECCINSGAIYIYDLAALQRILDEERAILEANAWPSSAGQFVEHAAKDWLADSHPVFAVIQRAFGS